MPSWAQAQIEGVGTERLAVSEQLLDLPDTPAALRRRALKSVVREDCVNAVGHAFHESSKEVRRDTTRRLFVEFRESEFTDAVDGHEQIQLAFCGPHFRQIDMDVPSGYGLNCRRVGGPATLGSLARLFVGSSRKSCLLSSLRWAGCSGRFRQPRGLFNPSSFFERVKRAARDNDALLNVEPLSRAPSRWISHVVSA